MQRNFLVKNLHSVKIASLIAGFALITSLPQFYLWYVRGSQWNGSCAYQDNDELAYSAYVNALIDGRPRRSDPYTGKNDNQIETLFSIQFLPAYAVALPARLLRVSAATAFIVLMPVATIVTTLVILWLLVELTQNSTLAGIGAVGVLCLGTVAAVNPISAFLGAPTGYDLLPFLRRYEPAIPFPIFLASCLFIWHALTRSSAWAILAGLGFAVLVYSYFFLWTAAAAWLFTILILWFIERPEDRHRVWEVAAILLAIGAMALAPYSRLLMHRAPALDRSQLLELTHAPDLFRAPELYGAAILSGLAYYARRSPQNRRDPRFLFTASLALATFLVFNQQVLTGRSLQPFHYEEFVTNYWIVLAFFLALNLLRPEVPRRVLVYLTVGTIAIAVLLGVRVTRVTRILNIPLDEARAVALKFKQESRNGVVFASDVFLTHSLPDIGEPVLWASHLKFFSNLSQREQKRRYYQYLYYSGFDEQRLATSLRGGFNLTVRREVFGIERVTPVFASVHNDITEEEISSAAREYAGFVNSFNLQDATDPLLSYAIVSPDDDLANLDKWYERGPAERIGKFIVYPLTMRCR
jgi:hypothetical protein